MSYHRVWKFKLYLFYNDYETSYTTYINHTRWHRCLRSGGLRVWGNRSTRRKPTCLTWWPHDHLTCRCRVLNPGRSGESRARYHYACQTYHKHFEPRRLFKKKTPDYYYANKTKSHTDCRVESQRKHTFKRNTMKTTTMVVVVLVMRVCLSGSWTVTHYVSCINVFTRIHLHSRILFKDNFQ